MEADRYFAIFLRYLCPAVQKLEHIFGWQGTNVQKYDGGYLRTMIVPGSSVVKGTLNEVRLTQCVERFASHHVRFSVVVKILRHTLNSPHTSAIFIDVLGHQLQFCQDPNSKHLGTTVWDASMVLVKFLERNCRKGRFSPSKLRGKRVIELGAGCGVAGFGMALLGCDVVSTDQTEVLPLLMRNVERNTSRIMQTISDPDSFGSIQAAELDWGNETHIKAVSPPFDYIIGTDVVYAEHLLEPLLQTIIALSGPKTTILLGHEIRSTNVHEKMLETWKRHFEVKTVPKAKMDSTYQHPSIQLYIMGFKSQGSSSEIVRQMAQQQTETKNGSDEDESKYGLNQGDVTDNDLVMDLENRKHSDWEARRCGAMAARLLRDVKIRGPKK